MKKTISDFIVKHSKEGKPNFVLPAKKYLKVVGGNSGDDDDNPFQGGKTKILQEVDDVLTNQ